MSIEIKHIPVLLEESISALNVQEKKIYFDGTFGGGGYTKAILHKNNSCRVIACDLDPQVHKRALQLKKDFPGRFDFFLGSFHNITNYLNQLKLTQVDGIVVDLGFSTFQLECQKRGFSFQKNSNLDMRMGNQEISAADVVNLFSEEEISDILYQYGEEYYSRRISRAIVRERKINKIETTFDLSDIIKKVYPSKNRRIHPATKSFQALRIFVNEELDKLEKGLKEFEKILSVGSRLIVVSFHSLEDRIAKRFFKLNSVKKYEEKQASFKLINKKVIKPQFEEKKNNPRSRSAKMRVVEKI